jgi:hypothetical protein
MIKANGDVHFIKHFPFIMPLVQSLPDPIVKVVDWVFDSDLMLIMNWQKVINHPTPLSDYIIDIPRT